MPKTQQTPAIVLQSLMEEYQLNPFSLSKSIGLSASSVRQIVIGKSGITVPTALRLAKFFGQEPSFWLNLQSQVDMQEAANDKELQEVLKGINKVKKPAAPAAKEKPQAKKAKDDKKTKTAEKPKKAAKAPGAKPAPKKAAPKKSAPKK